jgi:hypothetical protein
MAWRQASHMVSPPQAVDPDLLDQSVGAAQQGGRAANERCGRLSPWGFGNPPGGAVLLEIADEWQVGRRWFSLEAMTRVIEPQPLLVAEPMPFHLAPVH